MSIKYKIALLFSWLSSFILSIIGLSIYFFSAKERTEIFRTRLSNRAWSTAKIVSSIQNDNYTLISKLDTASVSSLYNKSIIVLNEKNEPIYKYSDVPSHQLLLGKEIINSVKNNKDFFFKNDDRVAVAIHYINSENNFVVAVAASNIDAETYLMGLKNLILWSLLISFSFLFFAGLLFANTIIKTISRIRSEVDLISLNNLSNRIHRGKTNDELYKLCQTFNNLLDRLQESFIIQRRFISNASHELSSPLTAISSQVEVALQRDRTVEEYKYVLLSLNDDVRELQILTRCLLDIAKTESHGTIDLSEVRIDEVLLKVIASVQKLQTSYKVSLNFETSPDIEELLTVYGNSNLLFIALKNIIENACKYSDDHHALVNTQFDKSSIIISINSKGEIIDETDLQNIFQPFFRTISAQMKQGSGLGLTIAKQILSIHKASINVESNTQYGTTFTINIPNKLTIG